MLNRTDLRGQVPSVAELRSTLPRAEYDVDAALHHVRPVVEAVRDRGVDAVLEYTEKFDKVRPTGVRVAAEQLTQALADLDPAVREALEESIARARKVHGDQRRQDVTTEVVEGGTVTERWIPVERVGLYAPGGLAVYPSTVVMNVVPAALLGVDEVWAAGGAQAVALLAYGGVDTDGGELVPVDTVTGPGNIYLTAAKRLLRGFIGIDSEAGPTEIAILADETADPVHVAADLISQAEHDPLAASVLVTTSEELADAVDKELAVRVPATKHSERVTEALSGKQSGIILVSTVDDGIRVVDAYAAEHLEIQTTEAREVAARVRNAGAIFVGAYAPVSLGDYCAGSNHVLPTGGFARHSSGLSVQSFLKGVHVVDYSEDALREIAGRVVALADAEDLPAHGEAITARFAGETA
jgi:histidinol dehydrogenase